MFDRRADADTVPYAVQALILVMYQVVVSAVDGRPRAAFDYSLLCFLVCMYL